MSEPSLPTSGTPLAFFDPESVCLRTSQGTLLSEAPELLQRLPNWGTTADGVLYEHQTPALLIDVRDGSASLPDIHANGFGSNLWDLPHLLPTPRAQNGEDRNMKPWVRPLDQPQNLENAVGRLLPTPTARDWKDTGNLKETVPDDDSLLPRAIAHHVTGACSPQPSPDGKES